MKKSNFVLAGLFVSGLAAADPTVEQLRSTLADKRRLEAAIMAGQRQAGFCFSCHGEQGISLQPEVPNLAGQPASYLLEQIRRFGDGRRRDDFMQGLLRAVPDKEKLNIALYFAAQRLGSGEPGSGSVEVGKGLYAQRCGSCHGPRGRGSDVMPTVAGQKVTYLVKSLKRYRDKSGERQHKEMSDSLAGLGDGELNHLASYMTLLN